MSQRSKKVGKSGLGKAIIKDKNRSKRGSGRAQADSWLHSSELDDGYDWSRLNLRSVTEESKLDEFLSTAKLAGTEFTAEKLNIKVVDPGVHTGLPSPSEYAEIELAQREYQHYLSIPRRPSWDSTTTAEQLDQSEKDSFLEWRRSLARLEENEKLVLTPFERNLEFWRQLWRVIERSDVVVQIVDARNPLLFRCEDLEKYVKEINSDKVNVLLISKSDLLTPQQRQAWWEYFTEHSPSITVAFWSATRETERLRQSEESHSPAPVPIPELEPDLEQNSSSIHKDATCTIDDDTIDTSTLESTSEQLACQRAADNMDNEIEDEIHKVSTTDGQELTTTQSTPKDQSKEVNEQTLNSINVLMESSNYNTQSLGSHNIELLTGEELVELLLSISPVKRGLTTVGMVGYPNVGKSSTINALIQSKKVPVSATPGRTKHFQTLYLSENLLLCDCPGLVFPTFVSTKAEMVVSGILPIDQMRDHIPPMSLVCSRIPRLMLEGVYGIRLPQPLEGEDPDRVPYADELCRAYGYVRGYMTSHGQPDGPRSARYILKDYVNGRLLYCHPPPGTEPAVFNQFSPSSCHSEHESMDPLTQSTEVSPMRSEFDQEYFRQAEVRAIKKSVVRLVGRSLGDTERKPSKKHNNRNKKEKTRRTQPAIVY